MVFGREVLELVLGDRATYEKTIFESEVSLFSEITGNSNPIHHDKEKGHGKIVHGALAAGLISSCITTNLPGPGVVCLEQQIKFLAPVYVGDKIKAEVEVIEINNEENRLKLKTICTNQHGAVVIDGYALVAPYKKDYA